jgi:hypothetical protein
VKKLFKLFVFMGLAAAVVVVVTSASRKRASEPRYIKPTSWTPPVVDDPKVDDTAIADAESEGMAPADDAVDVAFDASGAAVVAEVQEAVSEVEASEEVTETVEQAVAAAEDEGMTPPPEEPAEDVAVSSEGEVLVSELAAPAAHSRAPFQKFLNGPRGSVASISFFHDAKRDLSWLRISGLSEDKSCCSEMSVERSNNPPPFSISTHL